MADPTERERLIALGRLKPADAESLGPAPDQAYPLDEAACFDLVLKAIDEAERQVWQECDAINQPD